MKRCYYTLGVEEEFQLLEQGTYMLSNAWTYDIIQSIVRLLPQYQDRLKPEAKRGTLEVITPKHANVAALADNLYQTRSELAHALLNQGLVLGSAGTHPFAHWEDMENIYDKDGRYQGLEDEFQDILRSLLIFGLHVHVGFDEETLLDRLGTMKKVGDLKISVMNQARNWLAHLIALSANSTCWNGRFTGIKSYRNVVWKSWVRSGTPPILESMQAFEDQVSELMRMGIVDNGKRIWWDVRPHPFFGTLEFRIMDMPSTIHETIALAALCQALVATLTKRTLEGKPYVALESWQIDEMKWHAMRYGVRDESFPDFIEGKRLPFTSSAQSLFDMVKAAADDLGTGHYIESLRTVLMHGTGADQHIALGNTEQVAHHIAQQTMRGIPIIP